MRNFRAKSTPDPSFDPPEAGKQAGRKNFIRRTESFICGNCGEEVKGDGYTDHCPKCLWGRHVDAEIPGDRASECGEMMEPIESTYLSGKFKIHYKCNGCRHEFWVKAGEEDDRERLLELMVK